MTPTIVARDVHKSYGSGRNQTPILRGVSLEVARGEVVFLIGPSGSGKTTLLSLLGCILNPDRGMVKVLDHEVSCLSSDQLTAFRRNHLGFIFQSFNLLPTLSALDNVRLAFLIRGCSRGESKGRAADLLDLVGLSHRGRLFPAQLSTGECQRVAIARALAGGPAVLLADEPTASIDAENGQMVMRLLTGLVKDRGMTLMIVTHDNRIYPFADRILRLEDGRLANREKSLTDPEPQPAPRTATFDVSPANRCRPHKEFALC